MVANFPIFPEGFRAKSAQILAFRDTTRRLLISGSLVRAQQAEPVSKRFHKDVGQSRVALSGKPSGKLQEIQQTKDSGLSVRLLHAAVDRL